MSLARIRLCRVEAGHRRYLNAEMCRCSRLAAPTAPPTRPLSPRYNPIPSLALAVFHSALPQHAAAILVCAPSDPVQKAIYPAPPLFSEYISENAVTWSSSKACLLAGTAGVCFSLILMGTVSAPASEPCTWRSDSIAAEVYAGAERACGLCTRQPACTLKRDREVMRPRGTAARSAMYRRCLLKSWPIVLADERANHRS